MQYTHPIKPRYVLATTVAASIYFALLFLNSRAGVIDATSPLGVLVELLTLPFALLLVAVVGYCAIRIFYRKERNRMIIASLSIALLMGIMMALMP